jgi:predicted nucleic acid-binding protein
MEVVDSSGWIEYFVESERAALFAPAIEDAANLVVPIITVYEVFKKLRRDVGEDEALEAVALMKAGNVVLLDLPTVLEAAKESLSMADSIIYSVTLQLGATLWTQDAHFEGLPSVRYFPKPRQAPVGD